jgi:phosphoserine phosphatase
MLVSIEDDANCKSVRIPLIIDLDGTLVRSDLLVESAFAFLGANPFRLFELFPALMQGKAALKSLIAANTRLDVTNLPYDKNVLMLIRNARETGRPVYLASASNQRYVRAVAAHLGLFEGWFASDDTQNLSGPAKARHLVDTFKERGFDYIGNDRADLAVWAVARRRVAVQVSRAVRAKLLTLDRDAVFLEPPSNRMRAWIRLLRVHQWAKNALVFVPLLTARRFDLVSISEAIGAFFVFSLTASAICILNGLVDIETDREHPGKKQRPLAAGTVPILKALAIAPILLTIAMAAAVLIAPWFAAAVLGYLVLSTAYTFWLKRKMMAGIVVLAALYTIRVIGGAAAISVPVPEWLPGFFMFIFIALLLVSRYIELA